MEEWLMSLEDRPNLSVQGQTLSEPRKAQPRKFVSVFRIDGIPILPPLLTSEKRCQMRKFKQRAIEVERRLAERRGGKRIQTNDVLKGLSGETSRSEVASNYFSGSTCQRSHEIHESQCAGTEESSRIPTNLIQTQNGSNTDKEDACILTEGNTNLSNTNHCPDLQKSKALNHNNKNVVVVPQSSSEKQTQDDDALQQQGQHEVLANERKTNMQYLKPERPRHLLLGKTVSNVKDTDVNSSGIPAICINPPTPLIGQRPSDKVLSACESGDSSVITELASGVAPKPSYSDDVSSDESYNNPQLSGRDGSRTPGGGEVVSGGGNELKPHEKHINTTNKVIQFEDLQKDTSSRSSVTATGATPGQKDNNKKTTLEPPSGIMNRSATSPSFKSPASNRSPSHRDVLQMNLHVLTDNSLVRSNSFTLEGPSKALIDHMRQQKNIGDGSNNEECGNRTSVIKRPSPSRSAARDTVESRAKRVQKFELKPFRNAAPRVHAKMSLGRLTAAASSAASLRASNHVTGSPFSASYATNSALYKTKRSPYDSPKVSSANSSNQSHSNCQNRSQQLRKAASNPVTVKQVKSRNESMATLQSGEQPTVGSGFEKDLFANMESAHRERFLKLITEQQEEQRRMQQTFEQQQRLLFEQLSAEMNKAQIQTRRQSNQNPHHDSPTKGPTKVHCSSPKLQSIDTSPNPFSDYSDRTPSPRPRSPLTNVNTSGLSGVVGIGSNGKVVAASAATVEDLPSLGQQSDGSTSVTLTSCNTSSSAADDLVIRGRNICTPRQLVFPQENLSPGLGPHNPALAGYTREHASPPNSAELIAERRLRQQRARLEIERRSRAVTIINAYTRGYLVRRLFQTEQVQRIVQTIRDTLIFVLNLHMETCENAEEANNAANIRLKAQLIQQLCSARRTLHLVFLRTSIKERMEIIARDRKRIKTKLLSLKRKGTLRLAG